MKSFEKRLFLLFVFLFLFLVSIDVNAKTVSYSDFKKDFIENSSVLNLIRERINKGEAVTYFIDETDTSLTITINDVIPSFFKIDYVDGVITFSDDSVITSNLNDNSVINTLFVNDVLKRIGFLHGYVDANINRFLSTDLTQYSFDKDGIELSTKSFSYDSIDVIKPVSFKINLEKGYGNLVSTYVDNQDDLNDDNESLENEEKIESSKEKSMRIPVAIAALGGFIGLGIISGVKIKKEF